MSLRLSSNLMVGVSRIYGQLWTSYQVDVSHLLTAMANHKNSSKSVDMLVEKAPIDAITMEQKKSSLDHLMLADPMMLDLEGLNLDLPEGFNIQDFLKTPEQVRRSMQSVSSATRPSIDVARGGLSDLKGTSLSGAELNPTMTQQFGANDEDMAYYGFGYQNMG